MPGVGTTTVVGEVKGGQLEPEGRDIHAARDAIVANVMGRFVGSCTGWGTVVGIAAFWGSGGEVVVVNVSGTGLGSRLLLDKSRDSTTRLEGNGLLLILCECVPKCRGERVLHERVSCEYGNGIGMGLCGGLLGDCKIDCEGVCVIDGAGMYGDDSD